MRVPLRILVSLGVAVPVLASSGVAQAQNYSDLPPLAPMSEAEVRSLPAEYRAAPMTVQTNETVTTANGVETITRTRRIESRAPAVTGGYTPAPRYAPGYPQTNYTPAPMAAAPIVFERQQWLDECRRRTRGRGKDETGLIIGALLGAVVGGVAGYEIAGAGDRVAGAVAGLGGGGLIGGLLGSLFDGGRKKNRYDCEAALDGYLSQYGAPGARIASREMAYAPYPGGPGYSYGYGYPAGYSHGYTYAPPQQIVMVPVRSEVQQQVVVRETVREETYTVPGAVREIPAPAPSPKMIKSDR